MDIKEAKQIIKTTNSPYLKRDMEKFIKNQERKIRKKHWEDKKIINNKTKEIILKESY